jgi:uncharacterized membrane protein
MKATIVFVIAMFLLCTGTHAVIGSLGAFGGWLGAWAPFSYLIMVVVIAAPLAAIRMMLSWPQHVEPESPMAKYRRESPADGD